MTIDKTTPILIVDDYTTMVRIIRNLLMQLGFEEVDAAHDGAGALARLEERTYGLVIADWNMEPMSGLELLRRVRADPALESLPFIMVTTDNRPERMAAADEAGVSDCIIKPFNAATLESRIARAIAG